MIFSILTPQSNYYYASNPIVVDVQEISVPQDSTTSVITVAIDCDGLVSEFPIDAMGVSSAEFNIASAVRAAFLLKDSLSPDGATGYKAVRCKLQSVVQESLINGELFTQSYPVNPPQQIEVRYGGLRDYQRLLGVAPRDESQFLTLKPEDEVVGVGEPYFRAGVESATVFNLSEEGVQSITDGVSIYAEHNPFRRCFAFVNSYGIIETASAVMRDSKSFKVERDEFSRVSLPSVLPSVHFRAKTKSIRPQWKMSSGYNSREWIEWWASEFLISESHWLYIPNDGKWLPVTIEAGDETTIYDKAKGELFSVDFTVKPAL